MSSTKSAKRKATSDGARTAKKPAKSKEQKPRKPKGMVELTEGQILTDLMKKQWRLGKLIGWGGFGALYLGKYRAFVHLVVNTISQIRDGPFKIFERGEGLAFFLAGIFLFTRYSAGF